MSSGEGRPDPYRAFQRGRLAVDRHVSKVLQAEDMWAEETATDILLAEASPDVRYWKFTKRQESTVGADWLWWWIDTTGTSFGLLTQAKVLKRRGTGWHVDFGYRRRKTELAQIDKLLASSMKFSVAAAHVLYCGAPAYRVGLDCGLAHLDGAHCRDRERAGVSIVPSIVPHYLMSRVGGNLATEAFHWSLPLEDVADPGHPQPALHPLAAVHPDIAEFMRRPQVGARRVAKTMLEAVHSIAWDSSRRRYRKTRTTLFKKRCSPNYRVIVATSACPTWRTSSAGYATDLPPISKICSPTGPRQRGLPTLSPGSWSFATPNKRSGTSPHLPDTAGCPQSGTSPLSIPTIASSCRLRQCPGRTQDNGRRKPGSL